MWDAPPRYRPLERRLSELGWLPHTCALHPTTGRPPLTQLTPQVMATLDYLRAATPQLAVDVVGFSMGALLLWDAMTRTSQFPPTFVTVAAPLRGTWLGYLWPTGAGRDFRPHSAFLRRLIPPAQLARATRVACVASKRDGVVLPWRNALLPAASASRVLELGWHPRLPELPSCQEAICELLLEAAASTQPAPQPAS